MCVTEDCSLLSLDHVLQCYHRLLGKSSCSLLYRAPFVECGKHYALKWKNWSQLYASRFTWVYIVTLPFENLCATGVYFVLTLFYKMWALYQHCINGHPFYMQYAQALTLRHPIFLTFLTWWRFRSHQKCIQPNLTTTKWLGAHKIHSHKISSHGHFTYTTAQVQKMWLLQLVLWHCTLVKSDVLSHTLCCSHNPQSGRSAELHECIHVSSHALEANWKRSAEGAKVSTTVVVIKEWQESWNASCLFMTLLPLN